MHACTGTNAPMWSLGMSSIDGQTQVKQKAHCISKVSEKAQLRQLECLQDWAYCSGFMRFSDRVLKPAPGLLMPSLSLLSWGLTPDALEIIIITTNYPEPNNCHSKCTFLSSGL